MCEYQLSIAHHHFADAIRTIHQQHGQTYYRAHCILRIFNGVFSEF